MAQSDESRDERIVTVESFNPQLDVSEYINFAQTSTTWLDISVALGQIQEVDSETATVKLRRVIRVTMAPEEARSLGMLLLSAAQNFEVVYGPLRKGGYQGEEQ